MVVERLSEGGHPARDDTPDAEPEPGSELQLGTIVVKIGGSTLGSHDTSLRDVAALQRGGARPVVVHGGGKVVSDWMQRLGVRPRFIRGLRVTDEPSLEIAVAVLTGLVNKRLVAELNGLGGRAVGLSGVDGGMIEARVADPALGLVGEVAKIDPGPIRALADAGYIPVVASIAVSADRDGSGEPQLLNMNADTVAGEMAAALGVERLVMLTDVEGVLDTSRRLIPRLTRRHANQLMGSNVVAGGMVPKLGACLRALESVSSAHIVDGRRAGALIEALEDGDVGTRLS
jgi:acetylglutamate kinase